MLSFVPSYVSPQKRIIVTPTPVQRRALNHCQSSPDFGGIAFDDEDSGVTSAVLVEKNDESSSFSIIDEEEESLVKVKRVPSFKDAILLNAQEIEQEKKKERLELERREAALSRQKQRLRSKLIVREIKRCAKSTPDLSSLVNCLPKVEEDHEILGDTDATDYYARKSYGLTAYKSSRRLRIDEAKRKQYAINKRNSQRVGGTK